MRPLPLLAAASIAVLLLTGATPARPPIHRDVENPAIDMDAYLKVAKEAAAHRESRRLTEAEFLRMSREPGTIVLDARSEALYRMVHVKGAINLSFPDIAVETLKAALPDKDARILIYCNNNFFNADLAFPKKSIDASLNLSTYISLYSYGYRNVYELGPLRDIRASKLEFEGTHVENVMRAAAMRAKVAAEGPRER